MHGKKTYIHMKGNANTYYLQVLYPFTVHVCRYQVAFEQYHTYLQIKFTHAPTYVFNTISNTYFTREFVLIIQATPKSFINNHIAILTLLMTGATTE